MEINLKIIEFSSDVFSKSTQLKDIFISPLFSNTNFTINIFEAISKNEKYKIRTHSQIIKIGLYNGKSLLGVGEMNINRQTQKIKISSKEKNTKDSNSFLNGNFTNLQDNDYYLTIECIISNLNSNQKDSNQKKKKRTSSMETNRRTNNLGYNKDKEKEKEKDKKKKLKKNYDSRENLNKKKKSNNSIILLGNNDIDNDNDYNMKTNSTVIRSENNNIIKDILFSNNNNKNDISNPINLNNDDDRETNSNIFNLSFQKELFSDGVLILSSNKDDNFDNKNKDFSKNIDISDFENLINEFYEIYNNVSNNNISLSDNFKENFLLEYQYFLEKTCDIFNLYSKLSNEIRNQNDNIKKNIKNYSNRIKIIYKKDRNLKAKMQDIKIAELFKQNSDKEKNIYSNDIQNITNKLSLINIIKNDSLYLTKRNSLNQQKYNIFLKEIFKYIINNKKNKKYLKEYSKVINFIFNNKNEFNNNEENINDIQITNYDEQNKKNGNKIDLEQLKYKIDKLKQQYINETSKKEYYNSNLFKTNREKKKKNKNLKIKSDRSSNLGMNSDENYTNHGNIYTPNGKRINKFEQTSP